MTLWLCEVFVKTQSQRKPPTIVWSHYNSVYVLIALVWTVLNHQTGTTLRARFQHVNNDGGKTLPLLNNSLTQNLTMARGLLYFVMQRDRKVCHFWDSLLWWICIFGFLVDRLLLRVEHFNFGRRKDIVTYFVTCIRQLHRGVHNLSRRESGHVRWFITSDLLKQTKPVFHMKSIRY